MSADVLAVFAGGTDPIDPASAELHRRALVLLATANLPESEENYAACVEVCLAMRDRQLGHTAAPTDLDHRLAFSDAASRIAIDRLPATYDADEYAEMLTTVEREIRAGVERLHPHE